MALLLAAAILFLHQGFGLRYWYAEAMTASGAIVFLIGMLQLAAYFGAFDTFGYSFSTFRSQRRYQDLYEYTAGKSEERKHGELTFMPFLVVGLVFLLIGLLLHIGLE